MSSSHEPLPNALIVEDDPDYATLLANILQDDGCSVRTACDGVCALEEVHKKTPDVITLDIQMPRKSGVLFYRQLKSDPAFRHIPVVVVTGITHEAPQTETFVRSFLEVDHLPSPVAYLEKPVAPRELLRVVRASLRNETP